VCEKLNSKEVVWHHGFIFCPHLRLRIIIKENASSGDEEEDCGSDRKVPLKFWAKLDTLKSGERVSSLGTKDPGLKAPVML